MKINFAAQSMPTAGALVFGVAQDAGLGGAAADADRATGGAISKALGASRFSGKAHQTLTVLAPTGIDASRIVLYGLGKPEDITPRFIEEAGGNIFAALAKSGEKEAAVWMDRTEGSPVDIAAGAAHLGLGALLRSYRFDKYKTTLTDDDKPSLGALTLLVADVAVAEQAFEPLNAIAGGVFLARDVVSEPPNVLYPASMAERAQSLTALGVEVEVLGEAEMEELGFGALLGVGQGSRRESKTIVMRWNGGTPGDAPVCFVGKGVTFDTGGISIKPAAGMEDMKWDMGGSGTVLGLMHAVAARKAKANVVGLIGMAENMPDGNAQRPGDVVTSYSGQTIEIINTDAEGRLVLADVLWYAQEKYKPKAMIDLATLTGAIIIGLGHEYAGLYGTEDELVANIIAAGEETGEKMWRMPLDKGYEKQIESDIADVKNTGGRPGGSITAAMFLKRFTNDVPWAHIDIAGMAWSTKDQATTPKGATAFAVRALDRLVAHHYEG